jgi:hypothetical protein
LSSNYRKKIILFPAGASGHFLATFLSLDATKMLPNARIDLGQTLPLSIFIDNDLNKIKHAIEHDTNQTILSHFLNISQLSEFQNTHWIRKIHPHTNFFGFCKNVYYKKQQTEFVDWEQAGFIQRFDAMFENLYRCYFDTRNDPDCPSEVTIDFGKLNDIELLKKIFYEVNQIVPSDKKLDFAEQYINNQYATINDCDFLDINDIINHIQPKDLYDLVILLFIYEKNHKTIDKNRIWTIDNMPRNINDALKFLVENSKNYTIF